jgi:hypothetical protein
MSQPTADLSPTYIVIAGVLAIAPAPAPATLAELARQGTHYQVAPLASGTASVTDPQHRALAIAAELGRVLRGGRADQAPVKTLAALARRGLLTLVAHPGPRKTNWAFGRITDAGRRELARLDAELAAVD